MTDTKQQKSVHISSPLLEIGYYAKAKIQHIYALPVIILLDLVFTDSEGYKQLRLLSNEILFRQQFILPF